MVVADKLHGGLDHVHGDVEAVLAALALAQSLDLLLPEALPGHGKEVFQTRTGAFNGFPEKWKKIV